MQIFRNFDRFVFEFYIYSAREQVSAAWLPLSCVACIYFALATQEKNDYIEIENHKSIARHTESATV
jgi:hypothetical protein